MTFMGIPVVVCRHLPAGVAAFVSQPDVEGKRRIVVLGCASNRMEVSTTLPHEHSYEQRYLGSIG